MKWNKKKFMKNVSICLVALAIVAFILNYAPGFRRDKYADITNLIINDEDVTENLKQNIYIDENGGIYLSQEDVAHFFDKNIYYDNETSTIVTTSNTKTASLVFDQNQMTVNGVSQNLNSKLCKINEIIYIPISELKLVYNIDVKYIKDTDVVVIENLNKGLIKAEVEKEAKIKFRPRLISKNIGKVTQGEVVSCYYTTSKGWRLIRKEDGTLGYVKANVLENEYIVRQDFNDDIETQEIALNLQDGSKFSIYNNNQKTDIIIKTLFSFEANGTIGASEEITNIEDYTVWATISNSNLEKYTNSLIEHYKTRTELIDKIVSFVSKYRVKGINIDFRNVTNNNNFDRFIIELTPRLRELGITTNVILNNSFKEGNIIGVVDYLIREK